MMATHNNCIEQTEERPPARPLIRYLWGRVRELREALLEARSGDDPARTEALTLHFATTVLLLASVPAASMDDLEPKVLISAMLRSDVEISASGPTSHTWRMIEAAISADAHALQGPAFGDHTEPG